MGRTAEHGFPRWYKVGNAEVRDPTRIKTLANSQDDLTAGRYDSFESPKGTDYVVPVGKTLYITLLIGEAPISATQNYAVALGYGDDGVNNSASAPTAAVTLGRWVYKQGGHGDVFLPVFFTIPAGKYPWVQFGGQAGNLIALGVEV